MKAAKTNRTRSLSHSSISVANNSHSRRPLNLQENQDNLEEALFEMFTKDPSKKALLLRFLSQEKENLEMGTSKHKKSLNKRQLVYRSSPIALSRQRALKRNRISSSSATTNSSFAEIKPMSYSVPFDKLLEGVIAYVEVWNKGKECSAGAKAFMISMGAAVIDQFTNNVTHVVFKDGSFSTYQKAKLLKVHLVSILWLEAIRKSNIRIPEKDYPALGTESYEANITKICQDYDEMVEEEYSRSLSVTVKGRKTALPSELTSQNSDSSTASFCIVNSVSDVENSSKEWEKESSISHQSRHPSFRRRISLRKKSHGDKLQNSSSCFSSDNDSECGIVNGCLVKQKHGDSFYTDLTEQSYIDIKNDKSTDTNGQLSESISILSHKSFVNNSISGGLNFCRTSGECLLKESKSIDNIENNVGDKLREKNTSQSLDHLNKTRRNYINILSDRIICSAKNQNVSEKRLSKDSNLNCLIEKEIEQSNCFSSESVLHNLIEKHSKNEEEQNLLNIKTPNMSTNNSSKSSLNSENMPSLRLSESTDSDSLKELTANNSENLNEEVINDFNKEHENRKEHLIQNEVDINVEVKSTDDKDKKLRRLFNVNQTFSNMFDEDQTSSVSSKEAKICKKQLFIPLIPVTSTYNISNFLRGHKKLKSQTKSKQNSSKKVHSKETENTQEKETNLTLPTKAPTILLSKHIPNNLNSIELEIRKEVTEEHDKKSAVQTNKKLRKLYNLNQSLSNLFNQELESINVDKRVCKEYSDTLKKQHLVPLTPILVTYNVKKFLQEQNSKTKQNKNVTQQLKSNNTSSKKGCKKKCAPRKGNEEKTKKTVRRSLRFIEKEDKCKKNTTKETLDNSRKKRRTTLEFLPKTVKKCKIVNKKIKHKKTSIVCTRMHKPEVQMFIQIVRKLGEFFIEDEVSEKTTHLVVGETKRTINLLRAISRGCWVLSKEWLFRSLEARKWLKEEDFEITDFNASVQHCRIQRQMFGKLYSMDIFENCGAIYITRDSTPRCSDLEELVEICKGKIIKSSSRANIIVGTWVNFDNVICVSEKWILDSVSCNKRKSFKKYLITI